MNPWKGWLRSTIRNSALDTESANTSVDATTTRPGWRDHGPVAKSAKKRCDDFLHFFPVQGQEFVLYPLYGLIL